MSRFSKILFTASLISLFLCMTALAGNWEKDDKGWRYLENGSPVYNCWKTDTNGDYFWLGPDGYMVIGAYVDDGRYVDSTGRMVKNRWVQINGKWHYFEQSGREIQGTKKQISGLWYYFDYDGTMVTGWYNDGNNWVYCDENAGGHMLVSCWKKLEPAQDMSIDKNAFDESDGTYWFYFQNTGYVTRATDSDFKDFAIGGVHYAFDQNGIMQTGWVKISDTQPVIAGYRFYNNDKSLGTFGAAHVGWLSAYPPSEISSTGDVQWYYFDNKGVPAYGARVPSNDGTYALEANFKKITKNNVTYTYLFTEQGNPVYGLVQVRKTDGSFTSMYFGTKNQSCLQKATNIIEGDGTQWLYGFNSQGYGITGVSNGYLYYKGKAQRAVDDKLSYYTVNGNTYLVNTAGYIIKNYNKSKAPGTVEYKSDAAGMKDGGTAAVSVLLQPEYQEQE